MAIAAKMATDSASQKVLCEAPRRTGKRLAIDTIMMNHCLAVEGARATVYSTSKRTSMLIKKNVLQMLVDSGHESWILRHGEEYEALIMQHGEYIIVMRDPQKENSRPSVMTFYPKEPDTDLECI